MTFSVGFAQNLQVIVNDPEPFLSHRRREGGSPPRARLSHLRGCRKKLKSLEPRRPLRKRKALLRVLRGSLLFRAFATASCGWISSWPYGITYFWLLGQVLCEAQGREHSRSYVTGVATKYDCMDAGAGRSSCPEHLNKESEIYDHMVSYLRYDLLREPRIQESAASYGSSPSR